MTDIVGREKMPINLFAQHDAEQKKMCVEHTNEIQIDEIYILRWQTKPLLYFSRYLRYPEAEIAQYIFT